MYCVNRIGYFICSYMCSEVERKEASIKRFVTQSNLTRKINGVLSVISNVQEEMVIIVRGIIFLGGVLVIHLKEDFISTIRT
uniref:Uncharacterized protein n=1 Tax=Glossina palpalis gambiensis TaxID=67801 RepID=A0A1B0BG93_9MUSC